MKTHPQPTLWRNLFFPAVISLPMLFSLSGPALAAPAPAAPPVSLHGMFFPAAAAPAAALPEPQQQGSSNVPLRDDLFAGTEKFAKNATEANEVDMDPDSLSLVGGPDAHRAHRTLLNVVRHYEYDKPGMYNPADVDEYRRKLETGDWHCSVHTRDLKSGESTDICSRFRAPDMVERAIITVEPKELTFIHQIQKRNGDGGHLQSPGFDGSSFLPNTFFVPDTFGSSAALTAELRAQTEIFRAQALASTAELRAQMPQFAEQFKAGDPSWAHLRSFRLDPKAEQELKDLQKQLHFSPTPSFIVPTPEMLHP